MANNISDSRPQKWLALRVIVALAASGSIAFFNTSKTNLDWSASFIIPISAGVGVFLWLYVTELRSGLDRSAPASITLPFYPMARYPLRYWLLTAISLMLGGAASLLKEAVRGGGHFAFGATFVGMGFSILIAVGIFLKVVVPPKRESA